MTNDHFSGQVRHWQQTGLKFDANTKRATTTAQPALEATHVGPTPGAGNRVRPSPFLTLPPQQESDTAIFFQPPPLHLPPRLRARHLRPLPRDRRPPHGSRRPQGPHEVRHGEINGAGGVCSRGCSVHEGQGGLDECGGECQDGRGELGEEDCGEVRS